MKIAEYKLVQATEAREKSEAAKQLSEMVFRMPGGPVSSTDEPEAPVTA